MSDIIQLLPDHVANQIAAGEVVQRPASVVKELLENAIDAGATQINLLIKDAGKTLIQVADNGFGMSATDARLCFERHATSKIKQAEDLFNLNTKGFRGEALASIAAIAHVDLKTKPETEEVGTHIKIHGSELITQEVCVTPTGTIISVKNLFYNIPARRNFLKSNNVEIRHIIDEFQRVALAHPQVGFSLHHNGNELFQLSSSNHRQRIVAIFGGKTNEKLVPIAEDTELVKLSGFVGKPEFAKKSRGEQFFFVNHRFIKSPYLNHAVQAAYEGLLKEKTHPSYFLYLEIDASRIDINIHPTKTEIKFDDEHALYAILRSAIKHSLGQFSVAPVLDFDKDPTLETPYSFKEKQVSQPAIEVDRNFNPFEAETKQHVKSGGGNTSSIPNSFKKNSQTWEALYTGISDENEVPTIELESEEVTGSLFTEETLAVKEHLDIFQLHKKYIISSTKTGLLVIDQYRAHTRILYEELLVNITQTPALSQQLLFPLNLSFSAQEVEVLGALRDSLEQTGLIFSSLEKDNIEIVGIPTLISESETQILLEQLLADFSLEIPESGFTQTDVLAKSLAKSMAVRAGTVLNIEEQQHLVNQLFACKEPQVSPFGKKIYSMLTSTDLDKKFM